MLPSAMRRILPVTARALVRQQTAKNAAGAMSLVRPSVSMTVRSFASGFEPIKVPSPVLYGFAGQTAQGLFDAISSKHKGEDLHKQITQVQQELEQIAEQLKDINAQAVLNIGTDAQKKELIEQITKSVSPFTKSVILDLLESNKLHAIQRVVDSFAQLVKHEKKQIWFNIKSPLELSKDQLNRITTALRSHVQPGASVVVNTQVDPSVLGGLVVEADGNVLDISAARIISEFEQQIKQQQ